MADAPTTWTDLRRASDARRVDPCDPAPHQPHVAVLTCSDARISPALLFGQPEGSLFVVRVAGNLATAETVASLTYGVQHLGASTIVVLGHSHCGAVTAATGTGTDVEADPTLACLVDPIRRAVADGPACEDMACAVERNVAATVATLAHDPGPLGAAVRAGTVSLHGAVLDLTTNAVVDLPDGRPILTQTRSTHP